MPLQKPAEKAYGKLDGAVLFGLTKSGEVGPGEWLWAEFKEGQCAAVDRLKDSSGVKGRFDLTLPGDPEPDRLMDVRAVAKEGTTVVAGQELEAVKSKRIVFAGDESFFIRFTPELLALIADVFAL
jgi:hypothetical protein